MTHDFLQWLGILGTVLSGGIGIGRLKQKVDTVVEERERDADRYLARDAFQPFADEVLRRLERIESKQDRANGFKG